MKRRPRYGCKLCGKQYKLICWAAKHNERKHAGTAKFRSLETFGKSGF